MGQTAGRYISKLYLIIWVEMIKCKRWITNKYLSIEASMVMNSDLWNSLSHIFLSLLFHSAQVYLQYCKICTFSSPGVLVMF